MLPPQCPLTSLEAGAIRYSQTVGRRDKHRESNELGGALREELGRSRRPHAALKLVHLRPSKDLVCVCYLPAAVGAASRESLGNFDFGFQPSLERSRIETPATYSWIREHATVLIQGPPRS